MTNMSLCHPLLVEKLCYLNYNEETWNDKVFVSLI